MHLLKPFERSDVVQKPYDEAQAYTPRPVTSFLTNTITIINSMCIMILRQIIECGASWVFLFTSRFLGAALITTFSAAGMLLDSGNTK
jgi:hypothetical protein